MSFSTLYFETRTRPLQLSASNSDHRWSLIPPNPYLQNLVVCWKRWRKFLVQEYSWLQKKPQHYCWLQSMLHTATCKSTSYHMNHMYIKEQCTTHLGNKNQRVWGGPHSTWRTPTSKSNLNEESFKKICLLIMISWVFLLMMKFIKHISILY